uniref:Protein RFT1 homolog n=1 Tax=Syphacia muris TaxID=451379 RepID=A0A0N5ARR0_9BILA
MDNSLFSSFVPNLSFQFVSRIISFLLNTYLIRKVDLNLIGVVNVSLTLYYTTIIFLVREPFRRTFLSSSVSISSVLDHYWLCPTLYILAAVGLYPLWLVTSWPEQVTSPELALLAFGISAWIESLADPLVVICQRCSLNVQFAILQGIQIVAQRTFIVLFITATALPHITVFCYAQIFGSLLYLFAALIFTRRYLHEEGFITADGLFSQLHFVASKREIKTFISFLWHSVAKHLATEGGSFVLTFAVNMSHEYQAVYDAIDKIGSLIVRIVLTPLDQAAEVYFSRYLKRGEDTEKQDPVKVRNATTCLIGLVHLALIAGLIACTFAVPYSPLAVWIYGGQKFAEKHAANMLRIYCLYVVVIAVNGITECFAMSVMDNVETVKHGTFLSIASVIQFCIAALSSRFIWAYGIILGNTVIMIVRIIYNWKRIRSYLKGKVSFVATLPTLTIICLLMFALATSSLSYLIFGRENGIVHNAAHLAVGGALFMFIINYVYHNDECLAMFLRQYNHMRTD